MFLSLADVMRRINGLEGAAGGLHGAPPADEVGWVRCSDIDVVWFRQWEAQIADSLVWDHGRSDPMAASALALIWYAEAAGRLGGAAFRQFRRVPRLARSEVGIQVESTTGYVQGYALYSPRFWCLADDPDAGHPHATVVADIRQLAQRLSAEVQGHADEFLVHIQPGVRLPRRSLRGSFNDGLAVGIWVAGDQSAAAGASVLRDIELIRSASTPTASTAAAMELITDIQGKQHLSLVRQCCCYLYRVSDASSPCVTCPRVPVADRPSLLAHEHSH